MGIKGYYFSLDAFMGAAIILMGVILASTIYSSDTETSQVTYFSRDIVKVLSELKLSEVNNSYVTELIESGEIKNVNNSILEQIGEFWAENRTEEAKYLALNFTAPYLKKYGFGIYANDAELYSFQAEGNSLISSKKIVSGIAEGKPTEGYVAKVFVGGIEGRETSAFAYFGGFEGEGNLTKTFLLPSTLDIRSAYLEIDASSDFLLFVNGRPEGLFTINQTTVVMPDSWNISAANFTGGQNSITINFTKGTGYVAGGYLRVVYESNTSDSQITYYGSLASKKEQLPGIRGFINLYSSIFSDGTINSMKVYLHYYSNISAYMTIGNVTVFSSNSTGEQSVELQDALLRSKLDYITISNKTVPLRIGVAGNQTLPASEGIADVVLANDDSGSMEWCILNGCTSSMLPPARYCGTQANYRPELGSFCNWSTETYNLAAFGTVCSGRWHANCTASEQMKVEVLINATSSFISVLLSTPGNRMGLVEYSNPWNAVIPEGGSWTDRFAPFPDGIVGMQNLTISNALLSEHLLNYTDSFFGTCICCGIEKAHAILDAQSNSSRKRTLVVMSDGEATDKCTGVGTGNAKTDAIEAAERACDDNITVYAVGFGNDVDQETLMQMPCNNGSYFNASNMSQLLSAYTEIANQIVSVSYSAQTANISSGGNFSSTLYEDSYIEINYTPNLAYQFGMIPIKAETEAFGNNVTSGNFQIPEGGILSQAEAASYSADKWTDNLTIANSQHTRVFRLSEYGTDYQMLGDPFIVNAPVAAFEDSNTVFIHTGIGPQNSTGGSASDKLIYEYLIRVSGNATSVKAKSSGCIWNLTFYDGTSGLLLIPDDYSGSSRCHFLNGTYDNEDAMQEASYNLLKNFDFNNDGILDVKISQNSIQIDTITISKVPSLWGPSVIEVRIWQ